jgi:hypothetical protein
MQARALTACTDRFSFAAMSSGRMFASAILRKRSSSFGVHRVLRFSTMIRSPDRGAIQPQPQGEGNGKRATAARAGLPIDPAGDLERQRFNLFRCQRRA